MPPWYGPAIDRHPWLEHVESKPWRAFIGARALTLVDLLELSLEQRPEHHLDWFHEPEQFLAHECNPDVGIDILVALLLLFLPLFLGGC